MSRIEAGDFPYAGDCGHEQMPRFLAWLRTRLGTAHLPGIKDDIETRLGRSVSRSFVLRALQSALEDEEG